LDFDPSKPTTTTAATTPCPKLVGFVYKFNRLLLLLLLHVQPVHLHFTSPPKPAASSTSSSTPSTTTTTIITETTTKTTTKTTIVTTTETSSSSPFTPSTILVLFYTHIHSLIELIQLAVFILALIIALGLTVFVGMLVGFWW
jgi:hypothetical protein